MSLNVVFVQFKELIVMFDILFEHSLLKTLVKICKLQLIKILEVSSVIYFALLYFKRYFKLKKKVYILWISKN